MPSPVKPIPEGYNSLAPYLAVRGAADAIQFYKRAFNATERMRVPMPDGKIGHAELQLGDSILMLADEYPDFGFTAPADGGSPVLLHLYVPDVDAVFKQALAAGAKELRPVQNQFYGDRSGGLQDPFGHSWNIATHIEDLTPEEIQKRAPKTAC